jgi:hypothetical protein
MPAQSVDVNATPIRYNEGCPLDYRLNMSNGTVNINGAQAITTSGEQFTICPFAYRHFEGEMFRQLKKEWIEMFFVNEDGAICVLNFHGYSVRNFLKVVREKLFYEKGNLQVCDVEWIFKLKKLEKPVPNSNEKTSFFIADFAYKPLKKAVLDNHQMIRDSIDFIYAEKTAKAERVFESHAWKMPTGEAQNALPTGESKA